MNVFKTACNLLTRVSFKTRETKDYGNVLTCFPVVGALLGVGMCAAAALVFELTNRQAGTAFGAVGLPILYWWATRGRGLAGIAWSLEKWAEVRAQPEYDIYWRVCVFQALALLKLLGTAVILYTGSLFWLLIVPVLATAVLAELCRPPAAADGVLDDDGASRPWPGHWLVAAAVVLIVSGYLGALVAGLLSLVLAWLLVPALEKLLLSTVGELTEEGRCAAMELTELAALLVGVVYFLG